MHKSLAPWPVRTLSTAAAAYMHPDLAAALLLISIIAAVALLILSAKRFGVVAEVKV